MVRRISLALVLALAACGGKKGSTTPDGTGDGSGTGVLVKQRIVRFDTSNTAPINATVPHTKVWLEVTDETGAAKSYPVDEIESDCAAEAGGEMGALGTLRCVRDGNGANYIAVVRNDEIILLRQWVVPGEDDHDYEELSRIALPVGSKFAFPP